MDHYYLISIHINNKSCLVICSVIKNYKLYQTNKTLSRKLVLQNSEGDLQEANCCFEEATEFSS